MMHKQYLAHLADMTMALHDQFSYIVRKSSTFDPGFSYSLSHWAINVQKLARAQVSISPSIYKKTSGKPPGSHECAYIPEDFAPSHFFCEVARVRFLKFIYYNLL